VTDEFGSALGTNSAAKNITEYFAHSMSGNFGGIGRIWAEAAQWSFNGSGSENQTSHHFKRWWLRAAMARGHAHWLLKEREVAKPTKPIEAWRLDLPGNVGQYDQDWGTHAVLSTAQKKPVDDQTFPHYCDDEYNTEYNITQMQTQEIQSEAYGWPGFSFVYGAPVSRHALRKAQG